MNASKLISLIILFFSFACANAAVVLTQNANNLTVECDGVGNLNALDAWLLSNGGAMANTTCSPLTWTNDYMSLGGSCGASGSVSVTFTATDACEDFVTTTANFTIEDTIPPVITSPASDEVVECDGTGSLSSLQSWLDNNGGAFAVDGCSDIFWTNDYSTINEDCGNSGFVTVVFTASDDCGNISMTTATFIILDTTIPSIDSQASDVTVECDGNGNFNEINNWLSQNGGAFASELCSQVYWTNNYITTTDDCGETGETTVIFTVTDECGNSASTSATFTIQDTSSPVIITQAIDLVMTCNASNQEAVIDAWLANNGNALASDICSSSVIWANDYIAGSAAGQCNSQGNNVVTFFAMDECGFIASTSASITFIDFIDPTIVVSASNMIVECDGAGNVVELSAWLNNNGGAIATDDCGIITWTNDYSTLSNECGLTGSTVVTFTATDECSNTSTTSASFTIEDTTNPVINTPATDLTLECDDANQQAAINAWLSSNGGAISSDPCDTQAIVWIHDYIPEGENTDCGATGSVLVTFTATNNCGLFATTNATITIEDSTAPTIISNAVDAEFECDGNGNILEIEAWLIDNGGADATDACSDIVWTNDFTVLSDDCGSSGSVIVIFTATDDCDNIATISASFTIVDTVNPYIDNEATDIYLECDAPNKQATINAWLANNAGALASDMCSMNVTWTHDYDQELENLSCGVSGSILVTFTATDECGEFSTTTASINIEDNEDPTIDIVASDFVIECDGAGNVIQLSAWLNSNGGATATDACGVVTWTNDYNTLSNECGNTGSSLVTFTAFDECGNSATTSAFFTIEDTADPVVLLDASDETVTCDGAGNATELQAWLNNNGGATAGDICSSIFWTHDFVGTTINCGTAANVTFTATDECGLQATTSATFTAESMAGLIIDAQALDQVLECDAGNEVFFINAWIASNGGASASTSCNSSPNITWSNDYLTGSYANQCGGTGSVLVTFTATDNCGQSETTSATLTVVDTTPPVIVMQATDETVECDGNGNTVQLQSWLNGLGGANAIDFCSASTWINDFDILSNDCGETGSTSVTFTIIDECGNSSTTNATFTIEDTSAPVINVLASDLILDCNEVSLDAMINVWLANNAGALASDQCSGSVIWTHDYVPGSVSSLCDVSGNVVVTFTATDDCGLNSTTSALIQYMDSTPPTITTAPFDWFVECDGAGNTSTINAWLNFNGGATATDDCSTVIWSNDFNTFSYDCGFSGTTLITFTASDECGNTIQASANFTIEDSFGPTIVNSAVDLFVDCQAGNQQATIDAWLATNGGATATDNCSSTLNWIHDYVPGAGGNYCQGSGSGVVTFTAADECGNSTATVAVLTIIDDNDPVLVTEAFDVDLECDGSGNVFEIINWLGLNGGATATDDCSSINWTNDFVGISNNCGMAGSTIVTFTATDECNNSNSTQGILTILDSTPPIITIEASDLLLTCNPGGNVAEIEAWLINNGGAVATDLCGNIVWSNDFSGVIGNCVQSETIQVNFVAMDDCGNQATTDASLVIQSLCSPSLYLTGINTGDNSNSGNYTINPANGDITSTQYISSNADIKYNSGTSIEMDIGFEVPLGAIFEAYIEGCDN